MSDDTAKTIPLSDDPKEAIQIELLLRFSAITLGHDWNNPESWSPEAGKAIKALAFRIIKSTTQVLQKEDQQLRQLMELFKTKENGNGVN